MGRALRKYFQGMCGIWYGEIWAIWYGVERNINNKVWRIQRCDQYGMVLGG